MEIRNIAIIAHVDHGKTTLVDKIIEAGSFINERSDKNATGTRDREKGERRRDENKTRFFMNLGKRDGLNVGGMLRTIGEVS